MLAKETMALVRTLSSKDVPDLEQEDTKSSETGVSQSGPQKIECNTVFKIFNSSEPHLEENSDVLGLSII